jgi:hypothetical protein
MVMVRGQGLASPFARHMSLPHTLTGKLREENTFPGEPLARDYHGNGYIKISFFRSRRSTDFIKLYSIIPKHAVFFGDKI